MACTKCDHPLSDHPFGNPRDTLKNEYPPCTKCGCKEYAPAMFDCDHCGEMVTGALDDYCELCADKYYGGHRDVKSADAAGFEG